MGGDFVAFNTPYLAMYVLVCITCSTPASFGINRRYSAQARLREQREVRCHGPRVHCVEQLLLDTHSLLSVRTPTKWGSLLGMYLPFQHCFLFPAPTYMPRLVSREYPTKVPPPPSQLQRHGLGMYCSRLYRGPGMDRRTRTSTYYPMIDIHRSPTHPTHQSRNPHHVSQHRRISHKTHTIKGIHQFFILQQRLALISPSHQSTSSHQPPHQRSSPQKIYLYSGLTKSANVFGSPSYGCA